MNYILFPNASVTPAELGGKAGALHRLRQGGFNIPSWLVLSPQAFSVSLAESQQTNLKTATQHGQVAEIFRQVRLDSHAHNALCSALRELCPQNELVAVRSSGIEEDSASHSFAGQFQSYLSVQPSDVPEKVVGVWQSAFSEQNLAYRREHGLDSAQVPAVLIQRMVHAETAGVAFSTDPVSGQDDVLVSAVVGLGDRLVSGKVSADTYRVTRSGQVSESVRVASQPVLTEAQIQAVAQLTRQVEAFFGCPQDVEWAIESGTLYLLQARPITTPTHPPFQEHFFNLWDNSNIAESYPGYTLPLTFSFARRAYAEVYRQFCRILGVPQQRMLENANTFRCMLGLRQGRMYYNLLNWYRVLAILPGYQLNRHFMEQMMGVKQSLPEATARQVRPAPIAGWLDALHFVRTIFGLIIHYGLLETHIRQFYARLSATLGTQRPDLRNWQSDQLVADYRHLEGQLLARWDAPLLNDFFTMIFYGLLKSLTQKWCSDSQGSLRNSLLAGCGGVISAEPARLIRQMADSVTGDADFAEMLCTGTLAEILIALPAQPSFEQRYFAYLEKFGDRCLEELKLENPTLHDEPLVLLRAVGHFARQKRLSPTPAEENVPLTLATEAEAQAQRQLAGDPLRQLVFNWVLRNTRRLVRNRENLRFERTRVFGRARLIMLELGRRFHSARLLQDARDVFYLEVEEVLGTVEGTATTADLQGLVRIRQAEYARYRTQTTLPDRFETRGLPSIAQASVVSPSTQHKGETLAGLGCSPGRVRGQVRVIREPRNAVLQAGEILVADHTDPGWILLFATAAGLLVEHGSPLSHVAIVSREMGLPCVVAVPGLTDWLSDGDWVELDGASGIIQKLGEHTDYVH
ncbi:MAG TPA: PEP/pyruvate-binding domain-containing protein [Anaerolineales bacterium]|nr:PEP/pyruvate-binding domain-containing protein [Anaerolineales bacterium]